MKKILIVLLLSTQYFLAFATDTLTVHENESKMLTRNYLMAYDDARGDLTIKDIIKKNTFYKFNTTLPQLRFHHKALWLKFVLVNKTSQSLIPISITASVIDSFHLYIVGKDSQQILHFSSKDQKHPAFQITHNLTEVNCAILPDSERTIYLEIKSHTSNVVPITVSSANQFFSSLAEEDMAIGAFIGIILIMALYNLVLFFIVKDVSYIYYVLYIAFLGFNQVLLHGYGTNIFGDHQFMINALIIPLGRIFFWLTLITFVAEFLQLRVNFKSVSRYYFLFYVLHTLPLVMLLIGRSYLAYNFLTIGALITSFSLLVIGILLYLKGYQPAKFFLLGWGLFLISIIIAAARNNGFIQYNHFTANAILYSSALGLILFSVALADKINFYRRQKNESQLAALTIAVENERLITEQNIMLEQRVKERTQELIKSNKHLSVTIENLKSAQIQLVNNEKMASLGQLTAGIAHEINNPINFVSANVKPLRLDFIELFGLLDIYAEIENKEKVLEMTEKARAYGKKIDVEFIKTEILALLDGIEEGASRTSEIVQSLRTFSRTDESSLKPGDINQSVLNTLVILRSTIPHYININTHLGNLPLINCYPGKINQVLINLINNGIESIKEKHEHSREEITVTTRNLDNYISIEIKDTGIGMTDEVKQRIFEPFFTTKQVGEGTGLGLSIVFGIIEQHRGNIEVESAPGQGTTFVITLPKNLD